MPANGQIIWQGSPRGMVSKIMGWAKEGLERAARIWHRTMMPKHFTTEGARKYGYQPRSGELGPGGVPMEAPRLEIHGTDRRGRSYRRTIANPKYAWRKRRQMHTGRELVWSGRSEAAAAAAVRVSSRRSGEQLQGLAAMPLLPKYFYQYLRAGTYNRRTYDGMSQFTLKHDQPKKYEELVRSTPDEIDTLKTVVQRHIQRQITSFQSREIVQAA